jgi:hypothetical protein
MRDQRSQGTTDQTTDTVVMVRPAAFASNPETAASNAFQRAADGVEALQSRAVAEFDAMAKRLADAGVEVIVIDDTPQPRAPDAVFPNNWFSTHADGTVVLYPMLARNRRQERRLDLFETLRDSHRRRIDRLVDLTFHETQGRFLEGTGSLVLDRAARVAYACRSPRTDDRALSDWAAELSYEIHTFDAVDQRGQAIYHTNVMLSVGRDFAVAALDCVPDRAERDALSDRLLGSGRELVRLTREQVDEFAGNLLQLRSSDGVPLIALSERAWSALDVQQRRALERHGQVLAFAIPTIETAGGGSVRCMLAEIFLPAEVHHA